MPEGFTPVRESIATTHHDHLMLPNGKRLGDEKNLARILVDLDIPGASHTNGRQANAAAYAAHLDGIGKTGAQNAVTAWLEAKRS